MDRRSNFKIYLSLVLITSIISTFIAGGVLYTWFSRELKSQAESLKSEAAVKTAGTGAIDQPKLSYLTEKTTEEGYSVVDIAKKVGPSIVGIRMTVTNPQSRYFGDRAWQSKAEGSGVIISQDGYIMTNYHVVEYADSKSGVSQNTTLEIFLPDERQVKARFIGGDSKTDLAVIKIDLDNLPVADLGDSSKLQVGELAVAIGNPLGLEFAGSVTVGVISALNRTVETEDKTLTLIQTDAAINPGNSGGALLNSKGEVVGINTIKIQETGVEGLGFAIPMNDAKPIIDQLITYGYVKGRPQIGISGQEITQVLSKQYGLPVGIYIAEVTPGSGAAGAGIRKGDILVKLGGKDVKTMKDVDDVKKQYKAGDTVDIVIVRDGNTINMSLTFSEER